MLAFTCLLAGVLAWGNVRATSAMRDAWEERRAGNQKSACEPALRAAAKGKQMTIETPRNLIWKHIRAIGTCMMVTHDGNAIHARPMRGMARPEQNAIWFFTEAQSHADTEVERDSRACLTFSDVKSNTYVSVSGTMRAVRDPDRIADFWNDEADSYFSRGPDDPRATLLKFEPEDGQYWDCPSSTIVLAIKFIEAKIMGEHPSLGQSGKARFAASDGTI